MRLFTNRIGADSPSLVNAYTFCRRQYEVCLQSAMSSAGHTDHAFLTVVLPKVATELATCFPFSVSGKVITHRLTAYVTEQVLGICRSLSCARNSLDLFVHVFRRLSHDTSSASLRIRNKI